MHCPNTVRPVHMRCPNTTAMEGGSADIAGANICPSAMARIVPTILLHFHHPWRSDAEVQILQEQISVRTSCTYALS